MFSWRNITLQVLLIILFKGVSSEEQNELKQRYENDIERLNRKLKWYAENQEMLDRDVVKIKMKDQEIKELKETLENLRTQQSKSAVERKERTNERASDAKRIRDLERQVINFLLRIKINTLIKIYCLYIFKAFHVKFNSVTL